MLIVSAVASSKAVIVFDASGSMWGQIGGKAKITIAKDALKDVVKNWNDSVELGVMAYGHRRKGDCNDIEMISPISQVDKNGIISKVMAISPKGKTPISRALKKAADKLQYTEDKATIILISDGQETCDSDPCVVAKELEAKGIDFVTHVIGFNVDKKTSKQLSCIAKVTGGEYFSAKNAKELNKAIKTVAKKVQKAKPKPKPKPKVKKLDHTVEVTASESEGGKWIDADCRIYNEDRSDRWYIYPSKKEPGTKYIPVGKYTLNCEYNAFKKKDIPFEVKAGETTKVHVVMGQTGKVEVSASESEGGKWIDADCRAYNEDRSDSWGIYPRKKEPSIKQIPVGKYTLNCEYNAFKKKDIPFEVKAGEITKVHVVFVSFLINTKCEGKVNYEIYAPNGQLVFEKSGIECDKPLKVTLNPGTYTVSVTQDDNTKEQKFTIGGDSSSLTIDLTKQEPTKEELIKADTPQESKAKEKIADKKVQQDIQDMNNDIQEAKKMIEMMNSMLNPNANQKPQQKTTDDDMSVDDTEFFTK